MPAPIEHLLADVHLVGDLSRNVPQTVAVPGWDGVAPATQIHGGSSVITAHPEPRLAFVLTGQRAYTYDELLMLAAQALTAAALIGRPQV